MRSSRLASPRVAISDLGLASERFAEVSDRRRITCALGEGGKRLFGDAAR
jgi:hypothetical protein